MGKPAARLGDMTVHGGSIVMGFPTVVIGGQPAARLGDMHVCPMQTPAVVPIPHVGGPIILGSPTVLIGGQPAARVGDMATCVGPPDSIAPPGCPTVLIGEAGSGSAGGGMGKGSGDKAKPDEDSGDKGGGSTSSAAGGPDSGKKETHYLDVKFIDKGGFPISGVKYKVTSPQNEKFDGILGGKVERKGIKAGSYKIELRAIVKAEWSVKEAKVGESVTLTAQAAGFEEGTAATITIFEKDFNKADKLVKTFDDLKVSGGKVETEWEYIYEEDDEVTETDKKLSYSAPEYYFIVTVDGVQGRSGMLYYKDYIEVEAVDGDGNPIANEPFRVFLSNGEVREGTLDANGYAKIENVPPCKWDLEFSEEDGFIQEIDE